MEKLRNQKILITGGAGFIGSNLIETLIEHNKIVVVDDLSMGKRSNLPQNENLTFYQNTITNKPFMEQLLISEKFDYIFLLAAVASVADTIARPLETHEINQNANVAILEIIRIHHLNVKKLLFASSAAVYGDNQELPKRENSAINPLSPYAVDKFATERFVIDYGKLYGIPTVATRFFNVYGPKQNPKSPYSGVLSLIGEAAIHNKVFTVFGDGEQTRDFVYIADVISALNLLAIEQSAKFDVYNVATSHFVSLNQVIRLVEKIINTQIQIKHSTQRAGDITKSYADISKISALGFQPTHTINQGLTAYLASLRGPVEIEG